MTTYNRETPAWINPDGQDPATPSVVSLQNGYCLCVAHLADIHEDTDEDLEDWLDAMEFESVKQLREFASSGNQVYMIRYIEGEPAFGIGTTLQSAIADTNAYLDANEYTLEEFWNDGDADEGECDGPIGPPPPEEAQEESDESA